MHGLRDLACGAAAGAILALARAPVGLDLLEVPVTSAAAGAAFRAGGLLLVAVALGIGPPRALRPGRLLLGAALGFALLGWAAPAAWLPAARGELLLVLLLLGGIAHGLARGAGEDGEDGQRARPGRLEFAGLLLAGLVATGALEAPAHGLSLLGGGTRTDDAVMATTFLALAALGAAALGPPAARLLQRGGLAAPALLVVALASHFTSWNLERLAGPGALGAALARPAALLGRVGLEVEPLRTGSFGTPAFDALLAGQLLLPVAFALGVALHGARDRRRLAAICAGAGLGSTVHVWGWPLGSVALHGGAVPGWAALAAGLVALGGGVLAWSRARRGAAALALAASAALLPSPSDHRPELPVSPWGSFQPHLRVAFPGPEGLVTVESSPGGEPVATLDRHNLTPVAADLHHDARRIELSLALLPEEVRARGPRVLLVGQVTVDRADILEHAGATVDRTAPWNSAYDALEAELFPGEFRPGGERVSPREARARLEAGAYDLVLVPPVTGPVLPGLSSITAEWAAADPLAARPPAPPPGTVAVIWQDGRAPLAGAPLGEGVLLSFSADLSRLSVGVALGLSRHPLLHPPGQRQVLSPALLLDAPGARLQAWGAALGARLAAAADGKPRAALARGISLHLSAQAPSAPWDRPREGVEIDPRAVEAWREDALTHEPDAATRDLWEALASVLVEKRLPELLVGPVADVADAYPPWPALDRAVARGWEELLEPDRARPYMQRAAEAERP